MDHTYTTLHMNTQYYTKIWTIIKENVEHQMSERRISVSRFMDNKDKNCDSVIKYGRNI